MDTRPKIEPAKPKRVLSVTFNEDKSCFAVGLETGFMVLRTEQGTSMLKKDLAAGIGLAQMMGVSNVIAIVGGGRRPKFASHKVILWDEAKQRASIEINAVSSIRAVKVAVGKVVIALQNSVRIYKLRTGDLLMAYETADNLNGLVCLSQKQVAFPGRTPGQIQIVELSTGNVSIIPAHDTPLRALSFSPDGQLLASASDKGTIIRVYSTYNCALVCEVRRGMDHATIYDLCFSPSGTLLASTSDKGTLHIFDVPHPGAKSDFAPLSPITAPTMSGSRPGSSGGAGQSNGNDGKGKWGWLSQVPGLPRVFSDTYSFTSIPFSTDEPAGNFAAAADGATLGTTKAQKGLIGWYDEESLVVVGAGLDARWEKFQMARDDTGKRFVGRVGFKHYYNEP
ncbi:WD40 repeat-like protein [Cryphonectria parasitica EP155]|uniref:WD40 repeat-like protein n=1 Tax=Cryphonectria parasitica (strain ATCC 38755 / EP155) TaxID=660469 RepID=A0A9P4Y9B6_CRYP1|nr:WD40 repeat-like protein [Cryphonectria parasitica EP155]KAF3768878.1 WD40 repeat-like protein [Cryphonectria parasitica EP155]